MLKNIKSKYVIAIVFTYLKEGKKLILVKCNKNLQKNINISITNYQHYKGCYLEYDSINSKRIIKKYDGISNSLIFEGDYFDSKRNTNGVEYYEGTKIFEGEYLNGKRDHRGKEYYQNGKLKFDGEYLNGKRNGRGEEYYQNGMLMFLGNYLNDKKWSGDLYDKVGKMKDRLDNKLNGKGKEYDELGLLEFDGEYLNGTRNGKGTEYITGCLRYEGEYLNGEKHGKGKEYYFNGNLIFEGEYKNNLKWNGKGYYPSKPSNNLIYELKDGKGQIKEYIIIHYDI